MTTYKIPEMNIESLAAKIGKLNKRAEKLGCQPITIEIIARERMRAGMQPQSQMYLDSDTPPCFEKKCWYTDDSWVANQASALPATATGEVMDLLTVEVEGEKPSLNGWAFVAVLEAVEVEGGKLINLVQEVPGESCPAEFREVVGRCDHCCTKRYRTQTFVVRHADGAVKCVGRSCLKDFMGGHHSPDQLAAWAEMLAELEGLCKEASDWDGSGGYIKRFDLVEVLTITSAIITRDGWLSRTKVRESGYGTATVDLVMRLVNPHPLAAKDARAKLDAMAESMPAAATEAVAAVEWAKTRTDAECQASNYIANVNTVARMGWVDYRTAGIAASIVVAYRRALEKEVQMKKAAAKKPSNHVGTIGERRVFVVTVDRIIRTDGAYGTTGLHKMTDAEGNDLVWFASGNWLTEGKTYEVKGTVKAHGEYNGRKQTVIKRVTVQKEIEAEVAVG